jgi:hypothetical protein
MSQKPAVWTILPLVALAPFVMGGCGDLNELVMGYTTPEWTSVAKLRDGRQFVTDGSIALEVAVAEVEEPPQETSRAWFSEALSQHSVAERQELFSLKDIKASEGNPSIVVGPGNLQLEETYVTYLSNKLSSSHRVSFWQHSRMQPIVIVVDGVGAGAMKPLAQQ